MDFDKHAAPEAIQTVEDFIAAKDKLVAELNAIVGFDVRKLNTVTSPKYNVKLLECSYAERLEDFPLYIGFEMQTKGLGVFSRITNPVVGFFKEGDQWRGTYREFVGSQPATADSIRETFAKRLLQAGIRVEDLVDRPAPSPATP